MSLILTPLPGRKPVQVMVQGEYNPDLVSAAIRSELAEKVRCTTRVQPRDHY